MAKSAPLTVADPLVPISGPELVFGLVGAIGTDLDQVEGVLSEALRRVNYKPHVIRVSSLLHQLPQYKGLATKTFRSQFDKTRAHMHAGSELREKTGRGDALALLSVAKIRKLRELHTGDANRPLPDSRTAYILRSLKHPEEVSTLRGIYGRAFSLISAYEPRASRESNLTAKLASYVHSADLGSFRHESAELIQIDERESRTLGQNVRDAFPLADVFVDARSKPGLDSSIGRYIELLFGHPFHTPTRDEYAMFLAHGAALRSADLGRQVGAAVTSADGDVLAAGCNDVPRYGGGVYWPEDREDFRDFRVGQDSSVLFRQDLVTQFLMHLKDSKLLASHAQHTTPEALTRVLMRNKQFKESIANSIIEFGRSVHAEMVAISAAAHRGTSLRGGSIYSTTFPCHLCARHIVASGLERLIYIEPYPKSVAARLYPDSISVDPIERVSGKVIFQPFVGVAPASYTEMFRVHGERKTPSGKAVEWSPTTANPKLRRLVLSYVSIEQQITGKLLPEVLQKTKNRRIKSKWNRSKTIK
jgi:deoxycytidylate deaminase